MYTFDSRVRLSECDAKGYLTIEGIVNYMQDCSAMQYDDFGATIAYLYSKKQCWIINSWQLIIERRPRENEQITIGTLAYGSKGMYGYRNYVITDSEGNRCAYANTVWVLINTDTGKPMKVTQDAVIGFTGEPKISMEYADRKITVPIPLSSANRSIPILRNYIDSNNHVNNAKYILMATELLPEDFEVRQVRVQYLKSAYFGDNILTQIGQKDNNYYISLGDEQKQPFALLEFEGKQA